MHAVVLAAAAAVVAHAGDPTSGAVTGQVLGSLFTDQGERNQLLWTGYFIQRKPRKNNKDHERDGFLQSFELLRTRHLRRQEEAATCQRSLFSRTHSLQLFQHVLVAFGDKIDY